MNRVYGARGGPLGERALPRGAQFEDLRNEKGLHFEIGNDD